MSLRTVCATLLVLLVGALLAVLVWHSNQFDQDETAQRIADGRSTQWVGAPPNKALANVTRECDRSTAPSAPSAETSATQSPSIAGPRHPPEPKPTTGYPSGEVRTVQLVDAWSGKSLAGAEVLVRSKKQTADWRGLIRVAAFRYNGAVCRLAGYVPIRYHPGMGVPRYSMGRYGIPIVPLLPAARLHGVVRDVEGRPAAGWEITLVLPDLDPEMDDRDLFVRLDKARDLVLKPRSFHKKTTCKPDGHFALDDLAAGFHAWVSVSPPRRPLAVINQQIRALKPGEDRRLEIRSGRSAAVRGRVSDQHGRPVKGACITLGAPKDGGLGSATVHSDEAGRFRFTDASCGAWDLSVSGGDDAKGITEEDSFPKVRRHFTLGPHGEGGHHEIVVHRSLFVYGRVVDSQGRPVYDAWISEITDHPTFVEGRSDKNGCFRFGPMRPGMARIRARPGFLSPSVGHGQSPPADVRPGDRGVRLVMPLDSRIHGRVVDAETCDGVTATVLLLKDGACCKIDEADAEGRFGAIYLEPGTYDLVASASPHRFGVLRGMALAEGQTLNELEVTLRSGGTVVVTASNSRRNPTGSTTPRRYRVRAHAADRLIYDREATIGKRVRFCAPVGEVRLEVATLAGRRPATKRTVVVPQGQTVEVALALR